jgi:hypothetical protein
MFSVELKADTVTLGLTRLAAQMGDLTPVMDTATGSFGVGRAEVAGSSTTAGVTAQPFREGTFQFANSAAGDLIATADIGTVCYIVDDQTVAKTNGTSTRSPAGVVVDVDAQGVWVSFDEALTRAMLS